MAQTGKEASQFTVAILVARLEPVLAGQRTEVVRGSTLKLPPGGHAARRDAGLHPEMTPGRPQPRGLHQLWPLADAPFPMLGLSAQGMGSS